VSHHLSFGEKKRISLATILSMKPDIILLDEPTSNLDPRARRNVIEVIRGMSATKIIATHDLEMALELCQRGIVLDSGRVIADGHILDILKDKDLLEEHGLEVPYSLR
jgi:cobalt/nickel transport system ATP-binding protein